MEAKSGIKFDPKLIEFFNKMRTNYQFTSEEFEELENHILDHIEDLQMSGKPFSEAYEIAIASIGNLELISDDFEKIRSNTLTKVLSIALHLIFSKRVAALGVLFLAIAVSSNFAQKTMKPYKAKKIAIIRKDSINTKCY